MSASTIRALDHTARARQQQFAHQFGLVTSTADGDKRRQGSSADTDSSTKPPLAGQNLGVDYALTFVENAPVELISSLLLGWESVTASILQQLNRTTVPENTKLTDEQLERIKSNRNFAVNIYKATEFPGDEQRAPFWEQFTKRCYPAIDSLPKDMQVPDDIVNVGVVTNTLWKRFFLRLIELPFILGYAEPSDQELFNFQSPEADSLRRQLGRRLLTCSDLVGQRYTYSFDDEEYDPYRYPDLDFYLGDTSLRIEFPLEVIEKQIIVAFDVNDILGGTLTYNDSVEIALQGGEIRSESEGDFIIGGQLFASFDKDSPTSISAFGGYRFDVTFVPKEIDREFFNSMMGSGRRDKLVVPRLFAKYLPQPLEKLKVSVNTLFIVPPFEFEIDYNQTLESFVKVIQKKVRVAQINIKDVHGLILGAIRIPSDVNGVLKYKLSDMGWPTKINAFVTSL